MPPKTCRAKANPGGHKLPPRRAVPKELGLDPSQNVGVDGWSDLRDRFVAPFYLHCLNGNLVSLESDERQQLVQDMREVAPHITIEAAKALWAYEWRGAWMASWWTGVWRWPSLVAAVEPQLIPSRWVYAGQGHCFALSRVADPASQDVLLRYLQLYLNQPESYYDQSWVWLHFVTCPAFLARTFPAKSGLTGATGLGGSRLTWTDKATYSPAYTRLPTRWPQQSIPIEAVTLRLASTLGYGDSRSC